MSFDYEFDDVDLGEPGVFEFEGGTVAWIEEAEVYIEDPELGKFKIVGFKNRDQAEDFITWGDLEPHSDDPIPSSIIPKQTRKNLQWIELDN